MTLLKQAYIRNLAKTILQARLKSAWGSHWKHRWNMLKFPETEKAWREYQHYPSAAIDLALDEAKAAFSYFEAYELP